MPSGWVTRLQSGFYTVHCAPHTVVCGIRGKLKRLKEHTDFIAVGDQVEFSRLPDGSGVIESIQPRKTALVRKDPRPHEDYMQVLLANPDQIVIVFACAEPDPHPRMLDRFLVICEKQGIPAMILANKVDLVTPGRAKKLFSVYADLGYRVLFTSAKKSRGIDELRHCLSGKISALAGPSGVGKSSLMNAIQPGLGLMVSEVKAATSKGRHTTNVREMFPLAEGGYVADMPGLRSLSFWDIQPEELDGYFPDIREYVRDCQFSDCSHEHEPGCAVIRAVEDGKVSPERYESYLRMRLGGE